MKISKQSLRCYGVYRVAGLAYPVFTGYFKRSGNVSGLPKEVG